MAIKHHQRESKVALDAHVQLPENTHITLVGDESIILNYVSDNLPKKISICHAPEKNNYGR